MATILVVDDEQDILEMTKIMLTTSKHHVLTSLDGEAALEIVNNHHVDLILLDAVLPGIHGLDVCRILKRNMKTRQTPIVMFSALGTGVKMMLEDKDRADDYISKPFTRKLLLETIERALTNTRSSSENNEDLSVTNDVVEIPIHILNIQSS